MIRQQGEKVCREWRQNRRLRLGVLVAGLILGLHFVLTLSDRQQVLAETYDQQAGMLGRLEDASRESAWPRRAQQADAALVAMRDTLPEVGSAGLAQAELQAWLTGEATSAGLESTRVRAETTLEVPGHAGVWQVIARLDGTVPAGHLGQFLRGLSAGLPWIQAERLEIEEGRETRVGLIVRGYYRKPVEAGAAPDAPETAGAGRAAADEVPVARATP